LRRWKWTALIAIASAGILLAALLVAELTLLRSALQTDDRLLGTWQSDAERTIATIREGRAVDEKQEAALRKLFGKLRITYARSSYITELDGVTESHPYEVLGKDKVSVVLRDAGASQSWLELSEFTVIHFDGPDAYWLLSEIGSVREYFKRVK
jgi:hypothetical protein